MLRCPETKRRQRIISLGGDHGVLNALPSEKIFSIDRKHAMISLDEKISHMMAHGMAISWMNDVPEKDGSIPSDDRGPNGSPAGKRLLAKMKIRNKYGRVGTAYAYIRLWSDSFLKCWTKQRENSIWILTVTFPNFDENATSEYHTHVLAMGRSYDDHTPVIDYYFNELKNIREGVFRYSATHGKVINTCFDVLAYSADTPERRFILKQRLLGTYGMRSGWSGTVSGDKLPFCGRCFNKACRATKNDDSEKKVPRCGNCCGWSFGEAADVFTHSPVPESYPTLDVSDGEFNDYPKGREVPLTYISGEKYTFQWVKKGIKASLHNVIHGRWNKGHIESYLKVLGVSDWIIDKVKLVHDKKIIIRLGQWTKKRTVCGQNYLIWSVNPIFA